MSQEAMEMQALHRSLMKGRRRTAADRNTRYACPAGCGARTTKNQRKNKNRCHACRAPYPTP